jgi:TetR/AcrR family transcriptional regulator, transcriptional repressor for nem operon
MTTPVTAKGQRSRGLIVRTAARLMYEKGIVATSMDDVLSASGTGKSQMYHYFRSKEDLVVAVLDRQFQWSMAHQPSLHDEGCADLAQWRREVLEANEATGFAGCPIGAFAGQVAGSAALQAKCTDLFGRWQAALAALVGRAVRAGRLAPSTSPDRAALVLLGAVQGGALLSHVNQRQADLEHMLDAVLDSLGALY